eukprot:GHVP01057882.1.p1 GENE.GHVP01057882.1~~GHVP01057882.1.p1  ORF type:complete len:206 (-),score=27.80 GHVP01057882.1:181-798(-)
MCFSAIHQKPNFDCDKEMLKVLESALNVDFAFLALDPDDRETLCSLLSEATGNAALVSASNAGIKKKRSAVVPKILISCSRCHSVFNCHVAEELTWPLGSSRKEDIVPKLYCKFCQSPFAPWDVERKLIRVFLHYIEAIRYQDLICTKCKQVMQEERLHCPCGCLYKGRLTPYDFEEWCQKTLTVGNVCGMPILTEMIESWKATV